MAKIREIRNSRATPIIDVVRYGLDERTAFLVDAALIDCLPRPLCNQIHGHGIETSRARLAELEMRYGAQVLTTSRRAILIKPRTVARGGKC